ncbi:hypothetical protein DFJ58DRAFT_746182 [Suillus subalutaceus]|uniref:uncharacterized protein n=1 Tax=Suillus subalutaceus TaxID=48586 RepID=UPI001B87825F|nr:uncharacterized protein DFJ58DRAFT_746182 [Suillus subalutaceus]KAG1852155.1 hypothetical protein DFJ58DRAFT_746182 [Suillus subalutaceus]
MSSFSQAGQALLTLRQVLPNIFAASVLMQTSTLTYATSRPTCMPRHRRVKQVVPRQTSPESPSESSILLRWMLNTAVKSRAADSQEQQESHKQEENGSASHAAGKGALARLGKYWYHVRLIQSHETASLPSTARNRVRWQVVWWRGCKFPSSLGSPPSDVEQGDLVDELWQDQSKRREIRYCVARRMGPLLDTSREEDLIQNFMSAQPSKELDDILRPHIASLQKLLDSPDLSQCGAEAYPVIDYILRSGRNLDGVGAYSIPFCGDISSHEYAKIACWFAENIPGASSQFEKWLGGMPLAHAFTLVAHRKAGYFKKREWNNSALLKMAWDDLMVSYPADSFVADVDLECLTTLEAWMFEDSEEAGLAGNWQWSLDAGQYHRRWDVSTFLLRGFWAEITARVNLNNNSDATSADELSDVVAPSLPAEEDIAPVKRRPSLPAEECASVKRRPCFKEGPEREEKKIVIG